LILLCFFPLADITTGMQENSSSTRAKQNS
jgi:hypothetical protein